MLGVLLVGRFVKARTLRAMQTGTAWIMKTAQNCDGVNRIRREIRAGHEG